MRRSFWISFALLLALTTVSALAHPVPPPPPPPSHPHPAPNPHWDLSASLRTNVLGRGMVELDRHVNVARFDGYRLQAIVLRASSAQFPPIPGRVRLCFARGCTEFTALERNLHTYVSHPVGEYVTPYNAHAWRIETDGGVYLDSFTLRFGY